MVTKKTISKSTKRRTTKVIHHKLKTFNFFVAFAAVLGMMAGVLMVQTFYKIQLSPSHPRVSLGMFEYDVTNQKAVKRTDDSASALRSFLTAEAKDSGCIENGLWPSAYSVVAFTKDRSQVLLGYGCGETEARMFAVLKDGSWQAISPTNKFDVLTNAPECEYVKQYAIDKEIAPVCFTTSDATVKYKVR
jgi:hypothetical protein